MNLKFYFSIFFIFLIFSSIAFGQLPGRVIINNLEHEYDGKPKKVEVRTIPSNLQVRITYNKDTKAPTDAGKYEVFAEIVNSIWRGSATAEMTIKPKPVTITFGSTIFTYDGNRKNVSITTSPANLKLKVTYNPDPPINAGSYKVTVIVDEKNYEGSASTDILIEKATAEIVFGKLVEIFDGTPKSATISTKPAGLKVITTYNNSATIPTNAGKYNLKVVINEQNYIGEKTGTFVINTAPKVLRGKEIAVQEDVEPFTVDLSELIVDPDKDDQLTYSISKNSNENMFVELPINGSSLTIKLKPNVSGRAELTIKGTDKYDAWAESKIILDTEPVNDPPFLEIDNEIVNFIPFKDDPKPIIQSISIIDDDDDMLTGAQIFFNPRTYEINLDLLYFEQLGNIRGSFSRDAGTLNLVGLDTKENYEEALKSILYEHRSENTSDENRILTIYVDDGKASSNFVFKEVAVVDGFISISIPTAFTPNKDNVNNTWKILNVDLYSDLSITVYNRLGQKVFVSSKNNMEWDGTYNGEPAPMGSYYYVITIDSYGKVYTGSVTILR